jgi:predicted Zn-dependent peptidase
MRRFGFVLLCAVAAGPAHTQPAGRATPPTLGPPPKISLPPIHERNLPNGMRLLVVERHEIPLVDAILVIGTGPEADPAGKPGMATLVARMLTRGTPTRSATDIAAQTGTLGASLDAGSSWDHTIVSLHAPTATLDSAWSIFADVVLHPTFPDSEFARVKRERLTQLVQQSDRAPMVADQAFATILFGPDHPYGRPALGTERSVGSITVTDVRGFYDATYNAGNATLIVVGDVTAQAVDAKVRAMFGAWTRGPANADPVSPPSAPPAAPTTIYVIDKHDAPQSSIRIGAISAARWTPDYFPIDVMNTILGGAFTSRLNGNLRETHAYTYGAFSDFDLRRLPGPFLADAEVVAAKTDSSLLQFMHELNAIRDTVPTAELRKAKRYLELQLPGELETSRDIADQLVAVAVYHLPLDYYNTYQAHIAAVTRADVQRVARAYIDPSHMVIVVVGDRAAIEAPLRATNVGPIRDRGLDGLPTTQ